MMRRHRYWASWCQAMFAGSSPHTDFSTKGLESQDTQAIVDAWLAGAFSRDTMTELFRRGEVLPEGRSLELLAEIAGGEPVSPTALAL